MKTQFILLATLGLAATASPFVYAQSASTDYSISMETIDSGGTTLSSTDYSINASVNDSGSMVSAPVCGYMAKSGYVGQLYDVVGLALCAASASVSEEACMQLGATQLLDDSTVLSLGTATPEWSILSGPVASINPSGLATAAAVYQDCPAMVSAAFKGMSGTLSLMILNTNNDSYGTLAGNSQLENWLVQYFGPPPNANAGPNVDADGTGQTNLFKYLAGLNPIDPSSRFMVSIQAVPGQAGQMQIVFNPVVDGRTYTVISATSLNDSNWVTLSGTTQTDNGQQRTVTDLDAAGIESKFIQLYS